MFVTDEFVTATLRMRDEEAKRILIASEARRQVGQDGHGRTWRWRIEPGMEEAFRDLLGWLLSSQQGAPAEMAPPIAQVEAASTAPVEATAAQRGRPAWDGCVPACCARLA